MSMLSTLARWIKSEADLESQMAAKQEQLDKVRASAPPVFDIAATLKHNRRCQDLLAEINAIDAAQKVAAAEKAKAERAAEMAEEDVREAEIRKLAIAMSKLTVEICADSEKLSDKLKRHEEMRASIDEWNADRGSRAFVEDGESRVRRGPPRIKPAITELVTRWLDDSGNPVRDTIPNGEGGWTWNPAAKKKGQVKVVIQPEMELPPEMPERLADVIRLVDLKGEKLW